MGVDQAKISYLEGEVKRIISQRDGANIRAGKLQAIIDDLQDELRMVVAERDELLEQKERAEYTREDHMAGQADLAYSSGEDCRLRF